MYKELVKFKEDPDAKEITLPTVFLNKVVDLFYSWFYFQEFAKIYLLWH